MVHSSQKGNFSKAFAMFVQRYCDRKHASSLRITPAYDRRLTQVICNLGQPLFERLAALNPELANDEEGQDQFLNLGNGMSIRIRTGEVRVGVSKELLIQWMKFIGIWGLTLLAILKFGGAKQAKIGQNNTVFLGLPSHWILDKDHKVVFPKYLAKTPIDPLRGCDTYFIEHHAATKNLYMGKFFFGRFVEQLLISSADIGLRRRLILLMLHITSFFVMHWLFIRMPLTLFFAKELGWERALLKLDQWGLLQSVFVTTTHLSCQPTWVQSGNNFSVHLGHYAVAPSMHVDKEDPNKQYAGTYLPLVHAMPMKHWVWTEHDMQIIKEKYGFDDVVAVGVPEYVLTSQNLIKKVPNCLEVVIFDVTPVNPNSPEYQQLTFYYGKTSLACALLDQVCDVANEVSKELNTEVKITLKKKRRANRSRDDMIYHQYVDELTEKNKTFVVCDPVKNLSKLLKNDPFVVCRPYTSAAVAAAIGGAECVYFDPTMALDNNAPKMPKLSFVSGRQELKISMKRHLTEVMTRLR